jgi:hypothetical protein
VWRVASLTRGATGATGATLAHPTPDARATGATLAHPKPDAYLAPFAAAAGMDLRDPYGDCLPG